MQFILGNLVTKIKESERGCVGWRKRYRKRFPKRPSKSLPGLALGEFFLLAHPISPPPSHPPQSAWA